MSDTGNAGIGQEDSATNQMRFYVCVTCGHLKREDLFEDGACTCSICHEAKQEDVNWVEAPDSDGFVSKQDTEVE